MASEHTVPRDEKGAILSWSSIPPTPITLFWSAGLLSVPNSGPSFPIAETYRDANFRVEDESSRAKRPPQYRHLGSNRSAILV